MDGKQVVRCGLGRYVFERRGEFAGHVVRVGDAVWVEKVPGAGIVGAFCVRVTEVFEDGERAGGLPRVVGLWCV